MTTVEFFDILSTRENVSWSPYTARTRMALNYKRIPHKTTYLSLPDIPTNHQSHNIPANASGRAFTCPAINHPAANIAIQDSLPIAKYLESTFTGPDHPPLFPPGAMALSILLENVFATRLDPHLVPLLAPQIPAILDPKAQKHFIRTRTEIFGPLDQMCKDPEAEWALLEKEIKVFSDMLVASGGPFLMGEEPCYADFILVGMFVWIRAANPRDGDRVVAMGENQCFVKILAACEKWLV
ncbi:hypothetical protein HDU98_006372 [Podochytrium sp. JEL0797]|nr:hypothetical protein HDU98_006372 [Podochytrium sp. JEL0797]